MRTMRFIDACFGLRDQIDLKCTNIRRVCGGRVQKHPASRYYTAAVTRSLARPAVVELYAVASQGAVLLFYIVIVIII